MLYAYGKAIAAVVAAGLTAAQLALAGDNGFDRVELVQVAIAVVFAIGVYLVPLAPEYRWAKTAVGALLAALQVLTTAVVGGVEPDEWLVIALAVLGALGVAAAPAQSNNTVSAR